MNIKFNLILLGLIAGILSACEHSKVYDPTSQTTKDLVVPNGFDWEVSENVDFSVTSKVATTVAVYEDAACQSLLAVLPANENSAIYHLNVLKGTEKLFIQYPTADEKLEVITASVLRTKGEQEQASARIKLPENGTGKGNWWDKQNGVIYYPATSKGWGTIFFEDMWPKLGDYDFNDVAVWYKVMLNTNANAIYVSVRLNGLGGTQPYQLCLQLDDVKTKYIGEIDDLPNRGDGTGKYTLETQGDNPAVVSFDWGNKKGINGGKYFNTESQYQVDIENLEATEIGLVIYLNDDEIKVNTLDWYSFNFFIRNSVDGTEIHLKGYEPTAAFKDKYAQIVAGNEDLDPEVPYCTKKGFVWGVKVPLGIAHAIEKVDFREAYKFFGEWVTSNGQDKKNWFEEESGKKLRIEVGKSK